MTDYRQITNVTLAPWVVELLNNAPDTAAKVLHDNKFVAEVSEANEGNDGLPIGEPKSKTPSVSSKKKRIGGRIQGCSANIG